MKTKMQEYDIGNIIFYMIYSNILCILRNFLCNIIFYIRMLIIVDVLCPYCYQSNYFQVTTTSFSSSHMLVLVSFIIHFLTRKVLKYKIVSEVVPLYKFEPRELSF